MSMADDRSTAEIVATLREMERIREAIGRDDGWWIGEAADRLEAFVEAVTPFVVWYDMTQAHLELAEGEPLKSTECILQFMGSGASTRINWGDFQQLARAVDGR